MRAIALGALLATPFVLAFFSGGFFDEARLWALLAACVLLVVTVLITPRPLPRTTPGLLALVGLWGLTAWTGLSITWAPLDGPAFHDTQRLLLYSVWLTAALPLLRGRAIARAVTSVARWQSSIKSAAPLLWRLPVEAENIVSPSSGRCAGSTARARPSWAESERR